MMAFISPCSKLERAIAAFLVLQGKSATEETFVANDVRQRVFPNRTVLASGFNPTVPYRQGGVVFFSIQHHFNVLEDDQSPQLRAELDAYVGDTVDTMTVSDGNSLNAVADGITAAGRWLARKDSTAAGDAIAANNTDMVAFRCDWVKMETPFLTRGRIERDEQCWVEILNFSAFVSQATN